MASTRGCVHCRAWGTTVVTVRLGVQRRVGLAGDGGARAEGDDRGGDDGRARELRGLEHGSSLDLGPPGGGVEEHSARRPFRARNARVTPSCTVGGQVATTDFRILGPLEVVARQGSSSALAGARQRALLAILLLHVGEAVSSDRLIDELWGDEPPEAGSAALRVRVSQLRRALGPAGELLVTRPPGYALRLAPGELDLRASRGWARLVRARLRVARSASAAELLREAFALWRGPPFADLRYESFAP